MLLVHQDFWSWQRSGAWNTRRLLRHIGDYLATASPRYVEPTTPVDGNHEKKNEQADCPTSGLYWTNPPRLFRCRQQIDPLC